MNEDYDRLKKKLTFDPLDFDQELIELPLLIMEASELAAEYIARRDRAKNDLDLVMAEAAYNLRSNAIADSKGNPKQRSEAQIETEIPLYKSVQQAQKDLEDAKLALALWQALCDALRAKRDAIKVYADLTISGYLSPNLAQDQRRAEMRAVPRRRVIKSED